MNIDYILSKTVFENFNKNRNETMYYVMNNIAGRLVVKSRVDTYKRYDNNTRTVWFRFSAIANRTEIIYNSNIEIYF